MSTNTIGLTRKDYMGSKSTLCTGCGHDSITNNIISAFFQSGVSPYDVAKLSGIGCSSKTPTYFLNKSHGFNSLHGRMAPLATGAKLANRKLVNIGVSGDGDTASIGMGGFIHLVRRNLPVIYIIENNGVYGLTKGQFSATADKGSSIKSGQTSPYKTVDLCSMALDLGCDFVARSFSGDAKQLIPLLDAAIRHNGTAVIDIISPCVTFANHEGSTKSYSYVKENKFPLQELGFVQPQEEISVDYAEGETTQVNLPDGSHLILKKLDSANHDVKDRNRAMNKLIESRDSGKILTGLFYFNEHSTSFPEHLNLGEKPLIELDEENLRPKKQFWKQLNDQFK